MCYAFMVSPILSYLPEHKHGNVYIDMCTCTYAYTMVHVYFREMATYLKGDRSSQI